jgi:hypothetical protein
MSFFVKGLGFSRIWNYFPKGNPVEYVHSPMYRVHGLLVYRSMGLG